MYSHQQNRDHIFKTIFPMFVLASIFLWACAISWRKGTKYIFWQDLGELAMSTFLGKPQSERLSQGQV